MPTPSEVDQVIGRNIRTRREAKGLDQGALGALLADPLTNRQVSRYELGMNPINPHRLVDISAVLECSVRDLFQGVEPVTKVLEQIPEREQEIRQRLSELCIAMCVELGIGLKSVVKHG